MIQIFHCFISGYDLISTVYVDIWIHNLVILYKQNCWCCRFSFTWKRMLVASKYSISNMTYKSVSNMLDSNHTLIKNNQSWCVIMNKPDFKLIKLRSLTMPNNAFSASFKRATHLENTFDIPKIGSCPNSIVQRFYVYV